ncbi:MAG: glycosyltransferase [Rhizobiales bacterium]|nr:glycosyltransferase [Hyphomicrobiales bacterium]
MSWLTLCWIAFWLAFIPYCLGVWNLFLFRAPKVPEGAVPPVSVLMPARNEEARIRPALETIQETEGVEFELIVADDNSTDSTAEIVREFAKDDPRIKLVSTPPLAEGWGGKNHACHFLSTQASHEHMVFIDADMIVSPDCFARLSGHLANNDAALISGIPLQETATFWERVVIPTIHLMLLGYLPFIGMRYSTSPGFGAAVGQIIGVRKPEYEKIGGHEPIKGTMHDGVMLARLFRRNAIMTDLVNVTDLCATRMYENLAGIWAGFMKNAHEGIATPIALPIWTVLLAGGHILPPVLVIVAFATGRDPAVAIAACLLTYSLRLLLALRYHQSLSGTLLHPLGVGFMLVLSWIALFRRMAGRTVSWRDRAYDTK